MYKCFYRPRHNILPYIFNFYFRSELGPPADETNQSSPGAQGVFILKPPEYEETDKYGPPKYTELDNVPQKGDSQATASGTDIVMSPVQGINPSDLPPPYQGDNRPG